MKFEDPKSDADQTYRIKELPYEICTLFYNPSYPFWRSTLLNLVHMYMMCALDTCCSCTFESISLGLYWDTLINVTIT
jgi:hypothetical protein